MEFFANVFSVAQQWLFETVVQPLMFMLGMSGMIEDAYDGTGWLLIGLIEVAILIVVIGPLQRWRPAEPVRDRRAIRVDILYTLIYRVGLFRVVLFLAVQPWFDELFGWLRVNGLRTFQLDDLWPGVTDIAVVSLLLYILVFDFLEYWIHRGQHQLEWWWKLHALHHSQRQMTMWSDNRNHLLDAVLHDAIVVVVAQLIGVQPSQFIAVVVLSQLSESLQHANLRVWFGRIGERLWVSPRFHRRHHNIGVGHEWPLAADDAAARNTPRGGHEGDGIPPVGTAYGGCNFGVLLPWWDMLFRTADFTIRFDPTGIRDQVEPDEHGRVRDYGEGFWVQQWLGVKRLFGRG
ncbi:fatty acid hydroxylase [Xylophilus rhododendri]|uniref:Fatty acid hydroxylase n=1 Tax=Xylophilus rhododendri TaxID=2697032 RepID=A0A857JAF4_9BURK|nr:sterol desaturase family protein [Xylophilus rhododendri]QHI99962.1 fatty acid hydroxylase [Xylophilus rhododendri]